MLSHALRASSVKPSITYNGSASNDTNITTYTFTSVSIGTAATNRIVMVAVTSSSGTPARTITSATIAGVSATVLDVNTSFTNRTAFIYANIPTGTTATIVVTFSGAMTRCAVGSYSLYNLKSTNYIDSGTGSFSGTASATVSVPADGIVIAGIVQISNSNPFTWTNVDENYDIPLDAGTAEISGASRQVTTGNNSYTVTATATGSGGRMNVYVWR